MKGIMVHAECLYKRVGKKIQQDRGINTLNASYKDTHTYGTAP